MGEDGPNEGTNETDYIYQNATDYMPFKRTFDKKYLQ